MGQAGCSLVMFGDREIARDAKPLAGGDDHVKTGRMIDSAPKTPTIMRGN
ncbi:unannotated protein [freshwater metagenome]|uniref:Unannotated protein n=1 Tax=freshwater metagenome TaxID=449393 RepID=A0A6J6ZMR4_9ZZZZ